MKVIFLDFNGILDTWENFDVIDPSNLERLKKIVAFTGAKVVISSSIKRNYVRTGVKGPNLTMLIDVLLENEIDVLGVTPNLDCREDEILAYLDEHSEIERYVILDDDYDMERLSNHLIKLPSQMSGPTQRGLEDVHVMQAIMILGELQKNEYDIAERKLVPNS